MIDSLFPCILQELGLSEVEALCAHNIPRPLFEITELATFVVRSEYHGQWLEANHQRKAGFLDESLVESPLIAVSHQLKQSQQNV